MTRSPKNQELEAQQLTNIERELRGLREEIHRIFFLVLAIFIFVAMAVLDGILGREMVVVLTAVITVLALLVFTARSIAIWRFGPQSGVEARPSSAEQMDLSKLSFPSPTPPQT